MADDGSHRRAATVMAAVGIGAQLGWFVGLGALAAVVGIVLGLTARLELARHPLVPSAVRWRTVADVTLAAGLVGLFVVGLVAVG